MQSRLRLVVARAHVCALFQQLPYPIHVAASVAPTVEDEGRPAAFGAVWIDGQAVAFEQRGDARIVHAGARRFGACCIDAGVEQHLQNVRSIPPDAEPDEPLAVGPWVGAVRKQHLDERPMARTHGVVQRRGANVRIVLGLLLRGERGGAAQALPHRCRVAEEYLAEEILLGAPFEQHRSNRLALLEPRRAVGRNLDQERREVAAAGVDVGAFVEQQSRRFQLPAPSGLPEHRAPVRADPLHPLRLLAQHAAQRIHVAAPGSGNADLQEVAGLARQQGHASGILRLGPETPYSSLPRKPSLPK